MKSPQTLCWFGVPRLLPSLPVPSYRPFPPSCPVGKLGPGRAASWRALRESGEAEIAVNRGPGGNMRGRTKGSIFAVVLCWVLLLIGSTTAQAQGVSLGAVGGINLATLSVEDAGLDIGSEFGFNIGARLSATFSPQIGLIVGALYSQKGASATEQGVDVTFNLNYVDFPILAQFMLPASETGNVSVHFAAGPAIGLETSCKASGEQDGISVSFDCSELEVDTKSVDVGIMGLIGVDIQAGRGAVVLDVGYDLGITNVNDVSSGGSIKNRNLYIMAGYQFPLGSR